MSKIRSVRGVSEWHRREVRYAAARARAPVGKWLAEAIEAHLKRAPKPPADERLAKLESRVLQLEKYALMRGRR